MTFSSAKTTATNLANNGRDPDIRELAGAISALASATDAALQELLRHIKRAEKNAAEAERLVRQIR